MLNSKRLVIDRAVAENQELQRQWTRITRQRNCLQHDDELEALAMCCSLWEDAMAADPDRGVKRHEIEKFEATVREHYESLGMSGPAGPKFINR